MLIQGNALQIPLRDECVQCVVTSPPYWGLRDYGTARWSGGDPECSHMRGQRASDKSKLNGGRGQLDYEKSETQPFVGDCGRCGALRIDSQLGLERTPEEFVARMVAVFREVWRVLRADGTIWVNLGDSYATSGTVGTGGGWAGENAANYPNPPSQDRSKFTARKLDYQGLKAKDLCGIPWRVAFALQADGWYLRSDIIWAKPNPMPESVSDRPTKAHEYLFLLAKGERYFYDADAIREPGTYDHNGVRGYHEGNIDNDHKPTEIRGDGTSFVGRNRRTVWTIPTQPVQAT